MNCCHHTHWFESDASPHIDRDTTVSLYKAIRIVDLVRGTSSRPQVLYSMHRTGELQDIVGDVVRLDDKPVLTLRQVKAYIRHLDTRPTVEELARYVRRMP